jgi:uncharacterized Ntn-hydrolase superfamily protein
VRHGTYSIVARDPATGELGVAVQSHWFSVGSVVSWAQAGVGAVATQSVAEPAYGPRALDLLASGLAAPDALERLVGDDEHAAVRQVAVVDAAGRVAVHTGEGAIPHAGHVAGEAGEAFSVQANMMASPEVPAAMAAAFRASASRGEPLAERLVGALDAAEGAGGDVRGRQSAALLVVPAAADPPWRRAVDLRVEDHPEPLRELRRVLVLHRAYELATEGDDLVAEGRHADAGARYTAAAALAPDADELLFWAGLAAADRGDDEEALRLVRAAAARHPGWLQLLDQLPPHIAPSAARVRSAVGPAA